MSSVAGWEDTQAYLSQLQAALTDSADEHAIADIGRLAATVADCFLSREDQARADIRALATGIAAARDEASRADEIAGMRQSLADLEQRRQELEQGIRGLIADKTAESERVAELQRKAEELAEATRLVKARNESELPSIKHSISLYANISQIHWDFQAPSGRAKGRVLPAAAGQGGAAPAVFDIDTTTRTGVQVADDLWACIAEATALPDED